MGDLMINIDANKMLEIVNKNSDYTKIAEYIMEKYNNVFNLEQSKKIAKYLIMEKNYTKEDILDGKADDYLQKRAQAKLIELKSVRQKDEEGVEIPLKSQKHNTTKDEIKRFIILITGLASIVAVLGIKNYEFEEEKMKKETSINLGFLASDADSNIYDSEGNIVYQSILENKDPMTGEFLLLEQSLANNIIDVCIKDPSLFDIAIYDTYYNIQFNRIDRLSETWNYLQNYMANDEAFFDLLSTKLNGSFLNYILNILEASGEIKIGSSDYEKYKNAIEEYQSVNKFEKLSRSSMSSLKQMMDKYHDIGNNLYKENNKKIKNLVEEQKDEFGGRK